MGLGWGWGWGWGEDGGEGEERVTLPEAVMTIPPRVTLTSPLRSTLSTRMVLLRKTIVCCCAGCTFSILMATALMKVRQSPEAIIFLVQGAKGHM